MTTKVQGQVAASNQALLELRLPWMAVYLRNYRLPHPIQVGPPWKREVKGKLADMRGKVPRTFSTVTPLIHPSIHPPSIYYPPIPPSTIHSLPTHPSIHPLSIHSTTESLIAFPIFSSVTIDNLPSVHPSVLWLSILLSTNLSLKLCTHPLLHYSLPHAHTYLFIYPEPTHFLT